MTTLPVKFAEAPVADGIQKILPTSQPMTCPRCDSQLRITYHEPECLLCGYVDYDYTPKTNGAGSLLSSGTRYMLRYVGEFADLSDTLAHIQVRREHNRVVFYVDCPFCSSPMEQTSLSGKRREAREERYKCSEGHRVSLTPWKNDSFGWK